MRGSGQGLYVGLADDCYIVASEPYGVVEETSKYVRMDGEQGGEIVVLVGPPLEQAATPEQLDAALREALADQPTKAAANAVAEALGLPKREVYQRALQIKADG